MDPLIEHAQPEGAVRKRNGLLRVTAAGPQARQESPADRPNDGAVKDLVAYRSRAELEPHWVFHLVRAIPPVGNISIHRTTAPNEVLRPPRASPAP